MKPDEPKGPSWGERLWRTVARVIRRDPAAAGADAQVTRPAPPAAPGDPRLRPWAAPRRASWNDPGPSPWELPSAAGWGGGSDQIEGPDGSLTPEQEEAVRNAWAALPKAERHRRLRGGA